MTSVNSWIVEVVGRLSPDADLRTPARPQPFAALDVFRFLLSEQRRGHRTALVTLTGIFGSSSRALGAHMGVSESGEYRGYMSGGCIEAAIVAEARLAISAGEMRAVRFGQGSPFIDIRLPCGGGIDLHIHPDPVEDFLRETISCLEGRRPVVIQLTEGDDPPQCGSSDIGPSTGWRERTFFVRRAPALGWRERTFFVRHAPALRIVLMGRGAETSALVQLAAAYGAELAVYSPDDDVLASAKVHGAKVGHLLTPSTPVEFPADRWTAIVLLFHDHDWEPQLIDAALAGPAFYVGAMGSRATHAQRLEAARGRGVAPSTLARLRGPIGLIPATRDPATLALSTLAEIVAEFRDA